MKIFEITDLIYLRICIIRSILYTHHCFDDNNNNKDLFASFIFTMAFCTIEKKNYKNEQKC